jgi:glutamyl-Q tRNA(Asp) synthetase
MPHYIALPTDNLNKAPYASLDKVVTRFAPSPNGYLHLGHAYAAICAHDFARKHGGIFQLRIEDIDGIRSKSEYRQAIIADLEWMGLIHDGEVIFQSLREVSYRDALEKLKGIGLVYACNCSRSDIAAAIRDKPVVHGPDGPNYPGTCRHKNIDTNAPVNWRLNMNAALDKLGGVLKWRDLEQDEQTADPSLFGDIVLWRKDAIASYHLASIVDDASDGITHVVRGNDLFAYTAVHICLQKLLGLLQPVYWHHGLLSDDSLEKLAKSRGSRALRHLRESGANGIELANDIRRGKLPLGISLLRD